MLLRALLLALSAAVVGCASTPKPLLRPPPKGPSVDVKTAEGTVRGITEDGVNTFLGVPYAAPVSGLNRWLPPQAPPQRSGVLDATVYGDACEQTIALIPTWLINRAAEVALYETADLAGFASEKQSGDCLRLNIWAPASERGAGPVPAQPASAPANSPANSPASLPASAPATPGAPVMVMVHGGGLTSGSGRHPAMNGTLLAQKGVVVVNINYRLGSIGFLAGDGLFDDELMAGNRGFMDTVRALEWIRDNISNFGGDPNNVTLVGQSGGGTNAWSVMAAPSSKGLVHRAILMSGPINQVDIEDHKKLTKTMLEKWKVEPGDEAALADVSRENAISTETSNVLVGSKDNEYGAFSRMVLPSTGATGTAFLPDDVFTAIEKGRFDDIDIMVGSCDDDGKVAVVIVPLPTGMAIDIWNGFIKGLVADTDEGYEKMTEAYVEALSEEGATQAKVRLQTDALYRIRALRAAALHAQRTDAKGKTYAYQFKWKTPAYPEQLGALHGFDLVFAFGNIRTFPEALGIEEGKVDPRTQLLADQMMDAWVNFAKTGVPSSVKLPEWPEYEPENHKTMVFDVETRVVADPDGELRKLWD